MSRYQAVLFDAFGTLITLDRPVARLRAALAARLSVEIGEPEAAAAIRAEIAHYAAGCRAARDQASLELLHRECAAVLMGALGLAADQQQALAVLREAVVLRAYDDAAPALERLAERGMATAVVSNGDCSLDASLAAAGLPVAVVVDSARAGVAKPDPAIFRIALERLGVGPGQALHVGDSPELDGGGARAAGIDAVIVCRRGQPPPGAIASLAELDRLLA